MTELSTQTITRLLPDQSRHIYIGYSGGMDSQVLLHLCAAVPGIKSKITAVYIHHGLQQAADDWGLHCQQQCLELAVDFKMIKVNAASGSGESPEAAARQARYTALRGLLLSGDVLLLAQHREDQMETVLLQLFRGGGVQGLAAMPVSCGFGRGSMLRPLLNVAKQQIQDYAQRHALQWVEDPSNQKCDFDRNFLRNRIVPLLKQRWPSLDKTVARTAGNCAEAGQLLDDWAESSLETLIDPSERSLSLAKWRQFQQTQRTWLLRFWLQKFGLRPPSQAILQTITEQVIGARDDAKPQVFIQGYYIRKYRDKIYCIAGEYLQKPVNILQWEQVDAELRLNNGFRLIRVEASAGIDKLLWHEHKITVDFRRGGEKLKLPGREGQHCLKKLYQEVGIPPWERDVRPLIYLNGRLAAVAGLWVAEWVWRDQQGECYRLLWQS